jgi:ABC-type iron transport system FetAB permease component
MALQLFLKSLIIWIIPFLVSFGFYDKTGQLVGDYWVFKITMIAVLFLTTYFTFKNYYKESKLNWLRTSSFVIGVQVFIDFLVLVLIFKMEIWFYTYSVIPIYVGCITITNYFIFSNTKKNQ